jgi:hypothetical protein
MQEAFIRNGSQAVMPYRPMTSPKYAAQSTQTLGRRHAMSFSSPDGRECLPHRQWRRLLGVIARQRQNRSGPIKP